MTYHQPQVIQSDNAVNAIQGDLGKWFALYLDFRPMRPLVMTPLAYEADE
jgi:hypothetical protein